LRTWVDESESPLPKKARRGDAAGGEQEESRRRAGGEQEESKECVVCMDSNGVHFCARRTQNSRSYLRLASRWLAHPLRRWASCNL